MFSIPAIAGLFAGAAAGVFTAWRRKGNGADMAQYGAVFAVIGFLLGVMLSLVLPAPG